MGASRLQVSRQVRRALALSAVVVLASLGAADTARGAVPRAGVWSATAVDATDQQTAFAFKVRNHRDAERRRIKEVRFPDSISLPTRLPGVDDSACAVAHRVAGPPWINVRKDGTWGSKRGLSALPPYGIGAIHGRFTSPTRLTGTYSLPSRMPERCPDLPPQRWSAVLKGTGEPEPPEPPPADCTAKVTVGVAEALSACFRIAGGVARSTDAVRINGVDLVPVDGAEIQIDLQRKVVTTRGDVEIKLGWVRLARRPLRLDLARTSAFKVTAGKDDPADIAGLPLTGSAELKFEPGRTVATASVGLPTLVKGRRRKFNTPSPTVEIGLQADNVHGLRPETIGAEWPWLRLPGGFELTDVSIKYKGTPDPATGQFQHGFEGAGTLWLKGVNPKGIEAKVAIASGGVFDVTAAAENLNQRLWLVVYLQRLGFTFGVKPFKLGSTVAITAGPQIKVRTQPPFHISRIDGDLTWANDNPDTWLITGKGDFALADFDGELKVVTSGKADLEGDVIFGVPGAEKYGIRGRVEGWLEGGTPESGAGGGGGSWGKGAALLQGRVRMSMPGFDAGNVDAALSSEGVAGCRRGIGPDVGFGYTWSGELEVMAKSCGLGRWTPPRPSASSAQAGTATRLRVPAGRRVVAFRVEGAGGAPVVSVTGPRGLRVDTPPGPDAGISTRSAVVIKDSARNTTYVAIDNPARGTYAVAPAAGSSQIAGVHSALALRPVRVRARVRGDGPRRRLAYRIGNVVGARVHFVEQGGDARQVIGSTRRRRGTLRFRSAAGSGRRRQIVAVVVRDGLVQTTRVVTRYRATAVPRAARPRHVRIQPRGTHATISWRGSRAQRYEVLVRTSDGRNLIYRAGGRRKRVVVRALPPRTRVRVTVRGYDALGRLGPAARATRRVPG